MLPTLDPHYRYVIHTRDHFGRERDMRVTPVTGESPTQCRERADALLTRIKFSGLHVVSNTRHLCRDEDNNASDLQRYLSAGPGRGAGPTILPGQGPGPGGGPGPGHPARDPSHPAQEEAPLPPVPERPV